ncbi:unnamed protein product [Rotaria sordida]|uniref:Uncharacterized protein n=1 Tax=Rotaria sordida TaxID=392033 RepID=A0A815NX70_9BILA|nr:unnamed protein product [Rotaria sordida]CAF1441153.1 unnamed protein product [Rotaria sordida]
MNLNKNRQQSETMEKKSNKRQRTRKVQYLKKKYRTSSPHMKTISNETNHQYIVEDMIEINEDKLLFISQESLLKKKYYPSYTGLNLDPTLLLSDYSQISNKDFQQMLFTISTTDTERQFLVELFNNEELLTYTRQLTQFINKLIYSKLQYEQWTYYYHLGIGEGI